MQRLKQNVKKPLAILTADWHLRDTQPIARIDDFWAAQWKIVRYISRIQRQHSCPVIHAGDLFHHWKTSPYLLSTAFKYLPDVFYTVYGNHDLPQHNLENKDKSGMNVLAQSGRIKILPGVHWGNFPEEKDVLVIQGKSILVWHTMSWVGRIPYPGCEKDTAHNVLRKCSGYDLIVTGHNHKPFFIEKEKQILVNPGSITWQEADTEHTPVVWLYYGDSVERVILPELFREETLTQNHLIHRKERDERIEAFVSKLNDDWCASVNFQNNLEQFFASNEIPSDVKQIIFESLEQS